MESQQWDEIYTHIGQGDTVYSRLSELGANSIKFINVCAVVTSYSVSKCSGSGSHKFCYSITLVDRSLERLSHSVRFNWFTNLDNLNIEIGDILRCIKLKYQVYNSFPQLTGNAHHSPIVLFRRQPPSSTVASSTSNSSSSNASTLAVAHDAVSLVTSLIQNRSGAYEVTNGDWTRIIPQDGNSHTSTLHVRDAHLVVMLQEWSFPAFYEMALADEILGDIPIHAALAHLNKQQSQAYVELLPAADPLLLRMPTAPFTTERCNIVCLIVGLLPAQPDGTPGGLLLWDGTARGSTTLPSEVTQWCDNIHKSMVSAREYSQCEKYSEAGFKAATARIVSGAAASTTAAAANDSPLEASQIGSHAGWSGLGTSLMAKVGDTHTKEFFIKFRDTLVPGTWIRLRNLHIEVNPTSASNNNNNNNSANNSSANNNYINSSSTNADGGNVGPIEEKYASIHTDTHFSIIPSYFHDVTSLVRTYYQRLTNLFLAEERAKTARVALTVPTESRREQHVKRKADGAYANIQEPTRLAFTLVNAEVPKRYRTTAGCKLVSWFPRQVDKFVASVDDSLENSSDNNSSSSSSSSSSTPKKLLFALRIKDDTEELDVLLSGRDAEYFLGASCCDFEANTNNIQTLVREKLEYLQVNEVKFDLNVVLFTTQEEIQAVGKRREIKPMKRFLVQDTQLVF